MRQRYGWLPCTLPLFLVGSSASLLIAGRGAEDNSTSVERLGHELKRLGVSDAAIVPLTGGALPKMFPSYDWYKWRNAYGKYGGSGYPHSPPPPLGFDDVFVVPHHSGPPIILNSVDGLKRFFQDHLAPIRGLEQARDAARAWLTVSTAIHRDDGWYQFTVDEDSIKARSSGPRIEVRGKAVVMRGGNGLIPIVMTFDEQGKLISCSDKAELHQGVRPMCHATKLLDPDPIVRKIAEQDLIIMGPWAKRYIDEQRARASPELQRAIDRVWERIEREELRWNASPDPGSR